MAAKANMFKNLQPGDAIEVIWKDACTAARWTSSEEAERMSLAVILTRGTLVAIREDALVVALDAGLHENGTPADYHGIGVVERNSIVEVHKLRRAGRQKKA